MSPVSRFNGFVISPAFVSGGSDRPVALAIDGGSLTQWIGEPATVVQTPMSEIFGLEVSIGRQLRLRATIGGVRYTWRTRRRIEHDELIELLRTHGARVRRVRTLLTGSVVAVVVVTLGASVASIASFFQSDPRPSNAQLLAVTVQSNDLPGNWHTSPGGFLTILAGKAGQVLSANAPAPKPTNFDNQISKALVANYQKCIGLTNRQDRLYGKAGAQPLLQIGGQTFGSTSFGGAEMASSIQYYKTPDQVAADVVQYSSPKFGACLALTSSQLLLGVINHSVVGVNTVGVTATFTPFTVTNGWRRGGIVTIKLPGQAGTYSLVTVLATHANEEVYLFALAGNWGAARGVITAAIGGVLARLDTGAVTASA